MKTLVYGGGPIGQRLALRLHRGGREVTLLTRGEALAKLRADGVVPVDGYRGEKLTAHVGLVNRIEPEEAYGLVIVPMRKSSRLAVCSALAANPQLENILFLDNEFAQMVDEFSELQAKAGIDTPNLDDLLGHITLGQEAN